MNDLQIDFMNKCSKLNTKTYIVTDSLIKAEGSKVGRVVITTRDNQAGEIVDKNVNTLKKVKENGIPMPNLLKLSISE